MKQFVLVLICMAFHWNAINLLAQDNNAVSLKDMILKKYDANRDGALVGIEKDGAITFLKGLDKNGDGEISAVEERGAIMALKSMPDPKSKPAKVMKGEAAGGTGEPDINIGERPKLFIPKKADKEEILYSKKRPIKNSPSEAYINLLLLTESGKIKEAEKLISKTVPDWLKKSFLSSDSKKEHGPINMETLKYKLREIKKNECRVGFSLNRKDKTYISGSRLVVIEDGKWLVK